MNTCYLAPVYTTAAASRFPKCPSGDFLIPSNLFRDDAADRLDTVLFGTVAERVRAASEYYRRVLQDREDRISELLNSWKEA
jgi:hypothetical protein